MFRYNPWVIGHDVAAEAPARVSDAYRRRESMWCSQCHASQRDRGLVAALLELYGREASSLIAALPAMCDIDIAEINRFNGAHDILTRLPRVRYVEYPEEDLRSLSFGDASFDVVLTSDTLEHVADPAAALKETRRVLRPGGRHLFTVPIRPDLDRTRSRAGQRPIYHGRPPGPFRHLRPPRADMLVRTDFGRDFPALIEAAGFDVDVRGEGVNVVYIARRPA